MLNVQSELQSEGTHTSVRTICSVLGVPRSTFYYRPTSTTVSRPVDLNLQKAIYQIIQQHPTYGLRRVRAMLYRELGQWMNRKRIHRIIKLNNWQIRCRRKGNRLRELPTNLSSPRQAPYLPRPLYRWETTMECTWNKGELEPKPDILLVAAELTELCADCETRGEALDRMSEAVRGVGVVGRKQPRTSIRHVL